MAPRGEREIEMLFTERSIWTMIHGIGLGGAALLGLAAALFYLYALWASEAGHRASPNGSRALAALTIFTAVMLWLTVLVGTYIIFPHTVRHLLQAPYDLTAISSLVDSSES